MNPEPARAQPPHVRQPRLGLILLDQAHARPGSDAEASDIGPVWSFTRPDAWPWPWTAAIAEGASGTATLAGEPGAIEGVRRAAGRIAADADLLVGNCGFFWAARDAVRAETGTPALLSSLDLLGLALDKTSGDVGIVTYSKPALGVMLERHPDRSRLRLLGLDELPQWSALAHDDYMTRDDWSVDGLREELRDHMARALEPGGELSGASLLVLECTILPYYRPALRDVTSLPMIDVASIAQALLA